MYKSIAIGLFFLLLIAGAAFGIWYLTLANDWPHWVGFSLLAGAIGLLLGMFFLRRYFLRSNEKKFVKRVIAKEGEAIFSAQEESSLLVSDLEKKWKESIKTLSNSKLSKDKNPIYALPWILVMGESGAGKTTFIKNSHLSLSITNIEASSIHSGTKNCDWWFFKDAIILDTAGRYAVSIEEKRDTDEWERFLSLLTKYRKKEPLNGIVIAISAEQLLQNNNVDIETDALSFRTRVNQLMLANGAKIPIYIMITKMDFIYGFTDFCDALPSELQKQAMGYMNEENDEHWDEVLQKSINFIKNKISSLQLLFTKNGTKNIEKSLLFLKEFDRIMPALKESLSIMFRDNPYQKIPMLRGIYFSSSLTDGQAQSKFLSDFKLPETKIKSTNESFFIHDFFKVILPKDRNVFLPIKEYLSWQRRNFKLAMTAWLLIFISLVGIYSYSYMQNISNIKNIDEITKQNNFKNLDLTSRILILDRLRLNILKINKANKNIISPNIPIVNFKQSKKAEVKLKQLFHRDFNQYVLRNLSYKIQKSIDKINNNTPSGDVVDYLGFLIDSIDILQQVQKDKNHFDISKHFAGFIEHVLLQEESRVEPSVSPLFVQSYIAFLKWNNDDNLIVEYISELQDKLSMIIDKKGVNLHWLTDVGVSLVPNITLNDFYKGINEELAKNSPSISGSLTKKGRENLIYHIKILSNKMKNPEKLQRNLKIFWIWYDERFYYRWKRFALNFPNATRLVNKDAKMQLLYSMTSEQNPFFRFIQKMASELKSYKSYSKSPQWTKATIDLDEILSISKSIRESKNSLISKLEKDKNNLVSKIEDKRLREIYINKIKSAGLLNKYIKDLTKLSIIVNKKSSQTLITDFFSSSDLNSPVSPSFGETQNHFNVFKHTLIPYDNTDFIYNLMAGQKNYIINYSINQMDKLLNTQWKSEVIGSVPLSSEKNLLKALFDKQKGLVWKFVDKRLKPFLTLDKYGYNIKSIDDYHLHIVPNFLKYINSGIGILNAYKPSYDISISALPFNINTDANIKPDFVKLGLQCAKTDYIIKNENYKITKSFVWTPFQCGDTIVTFGFKNFQVKKTYSGENGFLHFLKDFKDGTKTYSVGDFDTVPPQLALNNIKHIQVRYDINYKADMLKLLDKTPYELPSKVTEVLK
jgi:type VI secretion system protein ImpL